MQDLDMVWHVSRENPAVQGRPIGPAESEVRGLPTKQKFAESSKFVASVNFNNCDSTGKNLVLKMVPFDGQMPSAGASKGCSAVGNF